MSKAKIDDKSREPVFITTLRQSEKENYLGSYKNLDSLLRLVVSAVTGAKTDKETKAQVKIQAKKLAGILLGKDKEFLPIHNWNSAGHIDMFLAKWLGIPDTDPEDRVESAVLDFILEILGIADYAGADGVLPEQWQFQVEASIQKFVYLFLGVDIPTQAIMVLGTEQAKEMNEDDE